MPGSRERELNLNKIQSYLWKFVSYDPEFGVSIAGSIANSFRLNFKVVVGSGIVSGGVV